MLQPGHRQSALYRQAVLLAKEMYRITGGFPDGERAVLVYPLRRLALLLCQDIAAAALKKGKKQKRLRKGCLEHCIALEVLLEVAVATGITTAEEVEEATRLLAVIVTNLGNGGKKRKGISAHIN